MAFSNNFALFLVAAILIQGLDGARIRRSEGQLSSLQELFNNAKAQFDATTQDLQKLSSSVNIQDLTPLIANQTAELQARAETLTSGLKAQFEAHSTDLSNNTSSIISDAIGRLTESVSNLQSHVPNATEQGEELKQNFQNTVGTLIEEIGKVARATSEDAGAAQTNIETLSRSALANTVDAIQAIQRQLQKASGN